MLVQAIPGKIGDINLHETIPILRKKIFSIVFDRPADESHYRSHSDRAVVAGSPIFHVIMSELYEADSNASFRNRYNGSLVMCFEFNRPIIPA